MKTLDLISQITIYDNRSELPVEWFRLLEKASEAAQRAYAPYSEFKVGAALLLNNGEIITGNNQENAAFPSGLCAERTAAYYASSRYPEVPFNKLAITAINSKEKLTKPISPCGSCRQALLEYELKFKQRIEVLLAGEEGEVYVLKSIGDILPLFFSNEYLPYRM
jgi:cytidine deaminase